jgi:hypothetical protein
MRDIKRALTATVALLAASCAGLPARPALDGHTSTVSVRDVHEITLVAKAAMAPTPVYSIHIESGDLAYAYYGRRRSHFEDIESAIMVRRIGGRWRATEHHLVTGYNTPVE